MKLFKKLGTMVFGLALTMGMVVAGTSYQENNDHINEIPAVSRRNANAFVADHDGTQTDPYSVSDVLGLTANLGSYDNIGNHYVKGIICSAITIDATHNNAKFNIADETDPTAIMGTYRVKGLNGANFTASTAKSGDLVVIYGKIGKHEGNVQVSNTAKKTDAELISKETPTYDLTAISLSGDKKVFLDSTLTIKVNYDSPYIDNSKKGVTFTSSDPTLATVTSDGVVTGKGLTDKVTITVQSTYKPELTASIDLAVVSLNYEGTYNWTFNENSGFQYDNEIDNYTKAINGFESKVFTVSSTKLFGNNGPFQDHLVLGTTSGKGQLTLKVNDAEHIIASIRLFGAKVAGKDNTNTVEDTYTSFNISEKNKGDEKTVVFFPCAQSVTLNTTKRVFASKIQIEVVKKSNSTRLAEVYEEAFLRLTDDGCGAKKVTKNDWTRVNTAFDRLNAVNTSAADLVKGWDLTVEAMQRYKICVEKYGTQVCSDFLAKGYEQHSPLISLTMDDNNVIISIITIAVLAVSAITLLVIVKRRKTAK